MFELILAVAAVAADPAPARPCTVDPAAILRSDPQTFDQDRSKGWRAMNGPECKKNLPGLIEAYRNILQDQIYSLLWHEGQVRAELGQVTEAIALFKQSKRPPMLGLSFESWNDYVDASIAFLKKDRKGLLEARGRLSQPKQGQDVPQNRQIVEALLNCFDRTYDEAYNSPACRQQPGSSPATAK
jgi:hypothetical protein